MKKLIADLNLGKIGGFSKGFTSSISETPQGFENLLSRIIGIFTIFAGIAFTLWLVIGAFTWITGDNPQQLDKAKKQMSSAIIGIIITAAIIPFTWIIGKITGLEILNFTNLISNLKL